MQNKIKEVLEKFENTLFPICCPCCGDILEKNKYGVCFSCIKVLKFVKNPRCLKCGRHIKDSSLEYCKECLTYKKTYIKGFPLLVYDNISSEMIYNFKYNNKREYAKGFAKLLYLRFRKEIAKLEIDCILAVPIHKKRLKNRGYNQAELLAKELEKYFKIRLEKDLLFRIKRTQALKDLSKSERVECLKEAFYVKDNVIKEKNIKKVLLIDDIYTTGATIEECTKILKFSGVEEVYYMSLCIA